MDTKGNSTISALIKEGLERRGMSESELGARVGRHQATVSKWATGDTRPSPALMPKIEVELDLPAGSLTGQLYGEVEMPPRSGVSERARLALEHIIEIRERLDHVESALRAIRQ